MTACLQVQQFYEAHTEDGTLLPQKRELTRRSLVRTQKTILQLRVEEKEIKSAYAAWKPCIALLSARVKRHPHINMFKCLILRFVAATID